MKGVKGGVMVKSVVNGCVARTNDYDYDFVLICLFDSVGGCPCGFGSYEGLKMRWCRGCALSYAWSLFTSVSSF